MKQNNSENKRVVAIMQPYFLPYIGYFQLINAVDEFIIYDNIEYTKKGWINRNRILANGEAQFITLTVKKDSDYLNVNERYLAGTWGKDKNKILNKIINSYRKAPHFDAVKPLIEEIINYDDDNLFNFIFNSIEKICDYLDIENQLIRSSKLDYNNSLKSQDKVIDICEVVAANVYCNPIGGVELYDKEAFSEKNITLHFLESEIKTYKQFKNEFLPALSILDVLMFNDKIVVKDWLKNYRLI